MAAVAVKAFDCLVAPMYIRKHKRTGQWEIKPDYEYENALRWFQSERRNALFDWLTIADELGIDGEAGFRVSAQIDRLRSRKFQGFLRMTRDMKNKRAVRGSDHGKNQHYSITFIPTNGYTMIAEFCERLNALGEE